MLQYLYWPQFNNFSRATVPLNRLCKSTLQQLRRLKFIILYIIIYYYFIILLFIISNFIWVQNDRIECAHVGKAEYHRLDNRARQFA